MNKFTIIPAKLVGGYAVFVDPNAVEEITSSGGQIRLVLSGGRKLKINAGELSNKDAIITVLNACFKSEVVARILAIKDLVGRYLNPETIISLEYRASSPVLMTRSGEITIFPSCDLGKYKTLVSHLCSVEAAESVVPLLAPSPGPSMAVRVKETLGMLERKQALDDRNDFEAAKREKPGYSVLPLVTPEYPSRFHGLMNVSDELALLVQRVHGADYFNATPNALAGLVEVTRRVDELRIAVRPMLQDADIKHVFTFNSRVNDLESFLGRLNWPPDLDLTKKLMMRQLASLASVRAIKTDKQQAKAA